MAKDFKAQTSDQNIIYAFGTNRPRTLLDDILDEHVLDKYYSDHIGEKKIPEKDKEILARSYLQPVRTSN